MRLPAEPRVTFNVRVSVPTDQLRRQLQERYGLSGGELVEKAFRILADIDRAATSSWPHEVAEHE
jgi:hypothetical protein